MYFKPLVLFFLVFQLCVQAQIKCNIFSIKIGSDDRGRLMRRNFIRYVLLSYVITLRKVSTCTKWDINTKFEILVNTHQWV